MRTKIVILAVVAFFASCGSCTKDNQNGQSAPASACADFDGDGHELGPDCEESTDCNDSDPTTYEGAEELCGDGRDNDCDNDIDEDCDVEGGCVAGAARECGNDRGRCTVGTQTCEAGEWTRCDGVRAISEACNGVDDDCDGEVDENPGDLCDDGLACNGESVCEMGSCTTPAAPDCSHLNGPCTLGECSEKDRGCISTPLKNGSVCDDSLFCTENGVCNAGECISSARDCAAEADGCNIGVCDENADACVKQPVSDGTSCEDGQFCTTGDLCSAGICNGAARDCSAVADQCNAGVCDETADACLPSPVTDGTTCQDGQYCTVADTCVAGACTGGTPRECSAVGGSCRDGVCDETLDACTGSPLPNGTACDDSMFCTDNDTCAAGICVGGGARDCASADGVCRVGTCDENLNLCVPAPAADGTGCDDGQFCTVNEMCVAGACTGSGRSCASTNTACATGICDDTADACVPQPVSDGTLCPDTLFCTIGEVCISGACSTAARDCTGSADVCNDGVCDDAVDACIAAPRPDGTFCITGDFCVVNTSCTAGVCDGAQRDCSFAGMGDPCFDGVCDELSNFCIATPNGTCDICDTSEPTAFAGPDSMAVPNQTTQLSGTGSSDPTNQSLNYSWRIASQPTGSSTTLSSTTSPAPTVLLDVAGSYVICLTVTDTDFCTSTEDCTTINVVPQADLHIELTWESDNSDFDLFYQAPNYSAAKWYTPQSVYYGSASPDWGNGTGDTPDGNPANNPSLDVDNITGFGPENVNQSNLFDGTPFTIGVHFFGNTNNGANVVTPPTNARLRVFVNGSEVFNQTRNLKCQDLWEAAEVHVSNFGTTVNVNAKNTVSTFDPGGNFLYCRCTSDADCSNGETCQSAGAPPRQWCVP